MLLAMMRMIPNNDSAMMIMMMMVVVGNHHRQEKRKVENSSVDSDLQCKPVSDPNEISSPCLPRRRELSFSSSLSYLFLSFCCRISSFDILHDEKKPMPRGN